MRRAVMSNDFVWLEPWAALDPSGGRSEAFATQLARELSPGHALYGIPVAAIGNHGGCDDVLFQLLDGTGRVAVVHLTWSQHSQEPPWPSSFMFDDFGTWAEECMKADHAEYLG
jgi:hypothetical protein